MLSTPFSDIGRQTRIFSVALGLSSLGPTVAICCACLLRATGATSPSAARGPGSLSSRALQLLPPKYRISRLRVHPMQSECIAVLRVPSRRKKRSCGWGVRRYRNTNSGFVARNPFSLQHGRTRPSRVPNRKLFPPAYPLIGDLGSRHRNVI